MLNQVYQRKDSWLAIVLHKTDLGWIVASFPSILYFVVDMLFKTNGRICSFEKKKVDYVNECVIHMIGPYAFLS